MQDISGLLVKDSGAPVKDSGHSVKDSGPAMKDPGPFCEVSGDVWLSRTAPTGNLSPSVRLPGACSAS